MTFILGGNQSVDYRAKEKHLYQVIASRDNEVQLLQKQIEEKDRDIIFLREDNRTLQEELRGLRSKERRRAFKRKKARE